jgi:predicted Ser/Thr protein kinase
MLGSSVAGYRVESVAGRGGMGVVYLARQIALDRPVALKLIAPDLARDEAFRARFARESRIAASLDHPNVIPVYEAGEDGERLFIAMRFVDGTDLAKMIAADGALAPALAAELVAQAASALDAAHARGLVHRDVKPGNLLVTGEGSSRPHVYLTDFGLARRDGSSTSLTTTGQWMGTPDYAAPEQIDGYELDARTDVYALGCVLFEALTGTPPFGERARMAKAAAHLHETPPTLRSRRPDVPPAFEPVVARALAKRPEERYASAGELGAAALAAAKASAATPRTRRLRRASAAPRPVEDRTTGKRGAAPAPAPVRTARLASTPRRRLVALTSILPAALAGAAIALGLVFVLGGFSDDQSMWTVPRASIPTGPPAANPSTGTVRCSTSSCTQHGGRVVPPIEASHCSVAGQSGTWHRIDDDTNVLFACVPDESLPDGTPIPAGATVPDLAGARLDHAEGYLDRLGIDHDTSGGGPFGIIDSGNYTVCTTTPGAYTPLTADTSITLFVEGSC